VLEVRQSTRRRSSRSSEAPAPTPANAAKLRMRTARSRYAVRGAERSRLAYSTTNLSMRCVNHSVMLGVIGGHAQVLLGGGIHCRQMRVDFDSHGHGEIARRGIPLKSRTCTRPKAILRARMESGAHGSGALGEVQIMGQRVGCPMGITPSATCVPAMAANIVNGSVAPHAKTVSQPSRMP